MHYFRVLVHVRDRGDCPDEGEMCPCHDPEALHQAIYRHAYARFGAQSADEYLRSCTPQFVQGIFSLQTSASGSKCPILVATWQDGRVSLRVELAIEETYAATKLGSVDSWTAASGTVYFKAPLILQEWIERGAVSEAAKPQCLAYQRQASAWHDIPLSACKGIRVVDADKQVAFVQEHAFRQADGEVYAGPVCVLAFAPPSLY